MARQFNYKRMQGKVEGVMARFAQGEVLLKRQVEGGLIDPAKPYLGNETVEHVFRLDATVESVADKFVDGTSIYATDSMVTAGPKMIKTMVGGAAVAEEEAETELQPGDKVAIDGDQVMVVREMRIPKAGTLVAFNMVVRS